MKTISTRTYSTNRTLRDCVLHVFVAIGFVEVEQCSCCLAFDSRVARRPCGGFRHGCNLIGKRSSRRGVVGGRSRYHPVTVSIRGSIHCRLRDGLHQRGRRSGTRDRRVGIAIAVIAIADAVAAASTMAASVLFPGKRCRHHWVGNHRLGVGILLLRSRRDGGGNAAALLFLGTAAWMLTSAGFRRCQEGIRNGRKGIPRSRWCWW